MCIYRQTHTYTHIIVVLSCANILHHESTKLCPCITVLWTSYNICTHTHTHTHTYTHTEYGVWTRIYVYTDKHTHTHTRTHVTVLQTSYNIILYTELTQIYVFRHRFFRIEFFFSDFFSNCFFEYMRFCFQYWSS